MSWKLARPDFQSGQAGVEAALTLPMVVFLILGTLQLFMMLQARVLAEYAAFWAVRTGSVNEGRCDRMLDSAVLTLLPTIARTDSAERLAGAFAARRNHRYDPLLDDGRDGAIVWIQREKPVASALPAEEINFDAPGALTRLEVRMVFWYPLRIPFANWVMSRMFLAHFGLRAYTAVNPVNPVAGHVNWIEPTPAVLDAEVATELRDRVGLGQYVFPIMATWSMRMMTPARQRNFIPATCR